MLVAVLVVAVALLFGGESGAQTSAGALSKKINKLTKKVALLQTQVTILELEQGKPRPASGPAGGDLTGTYPNPQIPAESIGSADIADGSVHAAEIDTGAAGSAELAGLVGVSNFAGVLSGGTGSTFVECPAGTDVISGSAWWDFPSGRLSASQEIPTEFFHGWRAEGQNEGMATQTLHVQAFCLPAGT